VKQLLFLSDFNQISIFSTDFRKHPNIKFHASQSNGSRVVPCGQRDRHGKANSRFRNFVMEIKIDINPKIGERRVPKNIRYD
jgi:hypothetical protein